MGCRQTKVSPFKKEIHIDAIPSDPKHSDEKDENRGSYERCKRNTSHPVQRCISSRRAIISAEHYIQSSKHRQSVQGGMPSVRSGQSTVLSHTYQKALKNISIMSTVQKLYFETPPPQDPDFNNKKY